MLSEKQKYYFLGLACSVAAIDGDFSTIEEELIKQYCREMQISYNSDELKTAANDVSNSIFEITEWDITAKKIIIFELIGLALSDNRYDYSEKNFINMIGNSFDIDENFTDSCEIAISSYIQFQNTLNKIIIS